MRYFPWPVRIILLGAVIALTLALAQRSPEAREQQQFGALVKTESAKVGSYPITIEGHGTVQALQQAKIAPEVNGRVAEVSEKLVIGGFFKTNEVMFGIEDRDYQLGVQIAESEVAQAERDLEITKANSRVAIQEWELMKNLTDEEVGDAKTKKPNALVLFEPQLKSARAQLAAARARLQQTQLNLERTKIRAPFNSFVKAKAVDLGQYIRAGEIAAELIGVDEVEVMVPLTAEDLRWVARALQPENQETTVVHATVSLKISDTEFHWKGEVSRILADVDERGRMHRIAVRVQDPYGGLQPDKKTLNPVPLSVGSFANVSVNAGTLENVIRLPRATIREDKVVWVLTKDETLEIKTVTLAHVTKDYVFIKSGLQAGDKVVQTTLSGAVPGMKLRPLKEGEASSA